MKILSKSIGIMQTQPPHQHLSTGSLSIFPMRRNHNGLQEMKTQQIQNQNVLQYASQAAAITANFHETKSSAPFKKKKNNHHQILTRFHQTIKRYRKDENLNLHQSGQNRYNTPNSILHFKERMKSTSYLDIRNHLKIAAKIG